MSALVTAVGAVTSIGAGAWTAVAAARAGLCGFRAHPWMIDSAGEAMRVAQVPWLEAEVPLAERCARMLVAAVDEAMAFAEPRIRTALLIGLPPERPGRPTELAAHLRRVVDQRYGARFTQVETFESGHAAALLATEAAIRSLRTGTVDACLVAGVDSYQAAETLEWIDASDQLHGGGLLNNAWGFIPGEGAGALLLQLFVGDRSTTLAEIVAVGTGRETALIKSDAVCIGAGLTQAFRNALTHLPDTARIDEIYCDLNGEAYRADEYGFSCLRTRDRLRSATGFVAAADCWGDVGAAGAILHAVQAIAACRKGYARGPLALVWASSEGGERAAAVLRAPVAARE